jgi:hypothetical protein
MTPSVLRAAILPFASCMLAGCSSVGAPSYELFGAFFPAWLLCGLIGIAGAVVAGIFLRSDRFNQVIPWPLAVCTAVGVIVGLISWKALAT